VYYCGLNNIRPNEIKFTGLGVTALLAFTATLKNEKINPAILLSNYNPAEAFSPIVL